MSQQLNLNLYAFSGPSSKAQDAAPPKDVAARVHSGNAMDTTGEDAPVTIMYQTFITATDCRNYYSRLLAQLRQNQDLNEVCHLGTVPAQGHTEHFCLHFVHHMDLQLRLFAVLGESIKCAFSAAASVVTACSC